MGLLKKTAKKAYGSLKSDVKDRYGRYKEEKKVYKEEYRKAKIKGLQARARKEGYRAGTSGGLLGQINPVTPSDLWYGRPAESKRKRKKKHKKKSKGYRKVVTTYY